MFGRSLILCAAFALAACDPSGQQADKSAAQPPLDSPAPESSTTRTFEAGNAAARATTGQISVAMPSRMPDAAHAGEAPQEALALSGANGFQLAADLTGAVSPATQVEGQTLRALLNIPVEEPQVLVYRVVTETKQQNGQGLCGASAANFVVVWEPTLPGEPVLKALGVMNAAPGAAGARPCTLLEYRRS